MQPVSSTHHTLLHLLALQDDPTAMAFSVYARKVRLLLREDAYEVPAKPALPLIDHCPTDASANWCSTFILRV